MMLSLYKDNVQNSLVRERLPATPLESAGVILHNIGGLSGTGRMCMGN